MLGHGGSVLSCKLFVRGEYCQIREDVYCQVRGGVMSDQEKSTVRSGEE